MPDREVTVYAQIIEHIFKRHYREGVREFEFQRGEILEAADQLRLSRPKNVGDVVYSFRYRQPLPKTITDQCGADEHWIIEGAGQAKYRFRIVKQARIEPAPGLYAIPVPDATPEIIRKYALTDEQALLAIVRYNRLVDLFLEITAYPLQSHLRSTIPGVGQIEIDELYVGVNKKGTHYAVPVQAKAGTDKIGVVQARQDLAFCAHRFPQLIARPVAVQFMADNVIAMFELLLDTRDGEVKVKEERHYQLVEAGDISDEVLAKLQQ
ncbi:MAG TPA: endonuclease [Dehalococcoidia bacterium]|nr:endonuclease [Dehalococcoidia bacterium]